MRPVILHHIASLASLAGPAGYRRSADMRDVSPLHDASIVIVDGHIHWVGRSTELDRATAPDAEELDCTGMTVLPGFVDCHTHAMFAGSRHDEFAMRASGRSYQDIAEAGGGILSTVRATRTASKRELKRTTARRLDAMMEHGTTTVEVKSGYGLSETDELKMLEALHELRQEHLATVVPTFLGAHAVPPEFAGNPGGYLDLLITRLLPYAARKGLSDTCDVFCESGYFSVEQTRRLLTTARSLGLKVRLHADQLNQIGASALGVELGAISVDHLECIDAAGIARLRGSSTAGVLLPGASFFLGGPYAPARDLIDQGIPVAIATNFNPGSCMSFSMPLMMTIACTQMRMSPEEALTASTINAAAVLGLADRVGSIEVGKAADIIVLDAPSYRSVAYEFGVNLVRRVIKNGVLLEFP
ncbi:MAG: imidazolonepropionase [Bacteroidetes bacterium]|jgi:imidazolonepropionase|nr:imidazolonepropionase [Bacteroidota bacterium]